MPEKQTEAEKAAQDRVNKAAFINAEVAERLAQYNDENFGVAPAKDARTEYPAAKVARTTEPAKNPKP